jgi:hypothetical protein
MAFGKGSRMEAYGPAGRNAFYVDTPAALCRNAGCGGAPF